MRWFFCIKKGKGLNPVENMTVLVKTKIDREEYAMIAMPKPLSMKEERIEIEGKTREVSFEGEQVFIDGSVEIVVEGIYYLK